MENVEDHLRWQISKQSSYMSGMWPKGLRNVCTPLAAGEREGTYLVGLAERFRITEYAGREVDQVQKDFARV